MSRHAPGTFFGHPKPLSTLFHIELWERFSYYGMQSILLIYLYYETTRGGLGIDQAVAGGIVGVYAGSVYLATILGAWLSDRVFGPERTLFYSGVVVMLGHIALAILPGAVGLTCGLVLVALGSGGVKPSSSTVLGSLYDEPAVSHMRDAGFSIFYLSVNIGGFFGPLLSGLLQTAYGFHYGFGLAAIGMAFGLWRYAYGRKALPQQGAPRPLQPGEGRRVLAGAGAALVLVALAFATGVVNIGNFSSAVLVIISLVVAGYFGRMLFGAGFTRDERRRVLAWIPLFLAGVVFAAVWAQLYTALTVYFDETVPRLVYGHEVPVGWVGSLQSLWVILLSAPMAVLWTRLGDKQPRTPLKFSLSLVVLGATYYVFSLFISHGVTMPFYVFVLMLLLLTLSELLLSPIGVSFATKIAPASFKAQAVAIFFLSISLGFTASGALFRNFYHKETAADFYILLTQISLGFAVVLLLLVPLLNRALKGVD